MLVRLSTIVKNLKFPPKILTTNILLFTKNYLVAIALFVMNLPLTVKYLVAANSLKGDRLIELS
ncbi:hypothetical protein F7734_48265 [Scytonema sp. UIC 10036]|uniref:hypothetical protein n=1 Tax=Scytonema sp. UIC 10036 TaxID=2304196 RepID=UPI0012DA589F|nr:hypothetical protein [Scytonema sp. UIC 10036]MUG99666.1 hypothetical protein [Scytonema sp. UIC 10036]